ncbi:MAG: hypothetical protein NC095_02360 [Muribaculum sp.]|nr:hypothetical protein [Muribaculum sp.]
MWTFFKIINFIWLLSSTRMWATTYLPILPLMMVINVLMILCLSMLPIKIEFTKKKGWVFLVFVLIAVWNTWCAGYKISIFTLLGYFPAIILIMLPVSYLKDLLNFTTKWYAILLIPGLLLYWVILFVDLPSFGQFIHPVYKPFDNYIFYIKNTFDHGTIARFNAFFLEPGHQALLSTFMLIANRFRIKECKWSIILLLSVIFSFSLAGYLLLFLGFVLLKINSIGKAIAVATVTALLIIGGRTYLGEDNSLNVLILERLEKDDSQGIKGNNRFAGDTDFVFERSLESGEAWFGISDKVNMDLILGAGYKIYVIQYGIIGALLALFFYISLIPPNPDYRYTLAFLIVLTTCFLQRAYPDWYSWLFPYITGIYTAKASDNNEFETPE